MMTIVNDDDDNDDEFDDAIMERLMQANMLMHQHFDTHRRAQ